MKRILFVLLPVMSGCAQPSHISKLFGGDKNIALVRSHGHVEAFRLRPPKSLSEYTGFYNKWPVLTGPVAVNAMIADELTALLLDENTYCLWDEGKGCKPSPGVLLRFSNGSGTIDIAFCFECNMMFTYEGSDPVYGANFDYSHNALLKYFVNLFPLDTDLPKLVLRPQ
jgi:hypothetical protein